MLNALNLKIGIVKKDLVDLLKSKGNISVFKGCDFLYEEGELELGLCFEGILWGTKGNYNIIWPYDFRGWRLKK